MSKKIIMEYVATANLNGQTFQTKATIENPTMTEEKEVINNITAVSLLQVEKMNKILGISKAEEKPQVKTSKVEKEEKVKKQEKDQEKIKIQEEIAEILNVEIPPFLLNNTDYAHPEKNKKNKIFIGSLSDKQIQHIAEVNKISSVSGKCSNIGDYCRKLIALGYKA